MKRQEDGESFSPSETVLRQQKRRPKASRLSPIVRASIRNILDETYPLAPAMYARHPRKSNNTLNDSYSALEPLIVLLRDSCNHSPIQFVVSILMT